MRTSRCQSPRLALLPVFDEEGWPSIQLCAEQLASHLSDRSLLPSERARPAFRRAFSRLSARKSLVNLDRATNRYLFYPLHTRRLREGSDFFHVVDHSYSHLLHSLPRGRAGVYCQDVDTFRCLFDPRGDPRPPWIRRIARHTLNGLQQAAVVFHSTQATAIQLIENDLVEPARLVHAPLGVAPEFTPHRVEDNTSAPQWLEDLSDVPWVLHVGSCLPRKRIDVLLEAFAEARQLVSDLRLLKIGGTWTDPQQQLIDRLGIGPAITHVPQASRPELAEAYRRATVVLQPSSAEGFGLPVIEAIACGATVVASDISALREVSGPAALFCPVGDVAAWADAIKRVAEGTASVPAIVDRLRWAAPFTWQAHADTIWNTYRRLWELGK